MDSRAGSVTRFDGYGTTGAGESGYGTWRDAAVDTWRYKSNNAEGIDACCWWRQCADCKIIWCLDCVNSLCCEPYIQLN